MSDAYTPVTEEPDASDAWRVTPAGGRPRLRRPYQVYPPSAAESTEEQPPQRRQQSPDGGPLYDPGVQSPLNEQFNALPAGRSERLPQVTDAASYENIPMGSDYSDPEGNRRTRPYEMRSDDIAEYDQIPDGATYTDPRGNERTKPRYEPVSLSTQTLYDMALTDSERRRTLEREYGRGTVQQDHRGYYAVDERGVLHRPGYGWRAGVGGVAAAALPVGLSVIGGVGGGVLGTPSGPGAFVAGATGAAGGGMLGQTANDLILQLFGVYDRTPTERGINVLESGAMSMMGAGVGRGLGVVAPTIREGISAASTAIPGAIRGLLGANREGLEIGSRVAERGGATTPSAVFPGAPHLANVAEVHAPAMNPQNLLRRNIENDYERQSARVLQEQGVPEFQGILRPIDNDNLASMVEAVQSGRRLDNREMRVLRHQGVDVPGSGVIGGDLRDMIVQENTARQTSARPSILRPEAAMSEREIQEWQAVNRRIIDNSRAADRVMEQRIAERSAGAGERATAQTENIAALERAAVTQREAAQELVNRGIADIRNTADDALRVAQAGHNNSDLALATGERMWGMREGFMGRAQNMYRQVEPLGRGVIPDSSGLAITAREFLEQVPEDFRRYYPSFIQQLERLGGEVNTATGQVVRAAEELTAPELWHMRTILRSNADWNTMSANFRNGLYKHFAGQVDNVLRDVERTPALRPMVTALNQADQFYRENVRIFDSEQIRSLTRLMESGVGVDPNILYQALVRPGHTAMTNRLLEAMGPVLRRGIEGTDLNTILMHSRDHLGSFDGTLFARQIRDRQQTGLLELIHGPDRARSLAQQADNVLVHNDARIPIAVREGDTVQDVIVRARAARVAADNAADADPLKALHQEITQIRTQERNARAAERRADPFNFATSETYGAARAADKILDSEDLIRAAAQRFGSDSSEFNLLRQTYARRFMQEGPKGIGERMGAVSEDIQALMFPGITRQNMATLVREFDFITRDAKLFQENMAVSMQAQSRVEHPIAGRLVSSALKILPGANTLARGAWDWYFGTVQRLATEKPAVFNYLMRGLQGNEQERQAVRDILSRHAQLYTARGAGVGQGLYQMPREREPQPVQ